MRFPRTLSLRVAGEIVVYSALGFVAIISVLVTQNLVRRLDELMMVGLTGSDFALVLRSLLPMLTAYATPIAFLFGVLLAMRRMSSDREVLAMRSCGLGLAGLLAPALGLAILASALSAWLMISVEHQARRDMVAVFKQAATKGGVLEPGRFRLIGPRLIFIDARDRDNRLEGVMILDLSNPARPLRIFAEEGMLRFDEDSDRLHIELARGDIHLPPPADAPADHRRLSFEHFDYGFDLSQLLGAAFSPTRPRQMTLGELRAVLDRAASGDPLFGLDQRDPVEYQIEIERRFALPLAPLLFALLAVPLGLRVSRGGRAWGVVLCIAIVCAYYALLALGQLAARAGWAPATVSLWLPNVLSLLVAAVLLVRESRSVPA